MLWFILGLLTGLASASQDAWVKGQFGDSVYEMLAYPLLYSLPMLALAMFIVAVPPLDSVFWWTVIVALPVNAVGFYLYMWAIQASPLSLTLPYLSFTPVFMFVTSPLLLGEIPNIWGVLGVCIIVAGSYVLNIDPATYTLFSPFKAYIKEKGVLVMLMVALVYSVAAVLGKKAILHSSVMFFTLTFFLVLNIAMLLILVIAGKIRPTRMTGKPVQGLVAGALFFTHLVCHGWAISMTKAVYMISLKRMSILFGVIYGGLFFSERHLGYRLIGAGLMVFGAALISLKG